MNKKSKKTTASPVPSKLESEKIWEEIKDLKLGMFTLPNQFVHLYYKPINVDPNKLYLTGLTKATSVLPALELAVSPKYQIEQVDRFIIVTLSTSLKK